MTREKLNWRSFDDLGAINRQWNLPATPTFCIIDQLGTIRHKWVGKAGEKAIDAALDKLVSEAEEPAPPK